MINLSLPVLDSPPRQAQLGPPLTLYICSFPSTYPSLLLPPSSPSRPRTADSSSDFWDSPAPGLVAVVAAAGQRTGAEVRHTDPRSSLSFDAAPSLPLHSFDAHTPDSVAMVYITYPSRPGRAGQRRRNLEWMNGLRREEERWEGKVEIRSRWTPTPSGAYRIRMVDGHGSPSQDW
jgi:hypothetical protein